jgi:hypothetical protein
VYTAAVTAIQAGEAAPAAAETAGEAS